jgi:hypothetical protein
MKGFQRFLSEEWQSTARFHTVLNPILWDGDCLRPDIRTKLLAFAGAWATFAKIPPILIDDVLLVGGSAGYNYTDKSDLDVHLLFDRNKLGKRDLVDELLQTKKSLWGLQHHVMVAGLPVEGFVQQFDDPSPKSQGVYSLKDNRWRQKPELPPVLDTSSAAYKSKVDSYIRRIDHLIKTNAPVEKFKQFKDRIKELRTASLKHGGEYSEGNMLVKELRNLGVLDRMTTYIRNAFDKKLSDSREIF